MENKTITQDQKMLKPLSSKKLTLIVCFLMAFGTINSFAQVPVSPTASSATNITCSSFIANWGAVTGATSYYLDVSTDATFASFFPGYTSLNVSNVTSYFIGGVLPNITYHYRVRASNGSGVSLNSNTISLLTCATGINETNSLGLFKVVPNPAKDELTVNINNNGSSIIIVTDVLGKTVKEIRTNELQTQINVSDLIDGVYFIKLTQDNSSYIEKIIIRK